MTVRSGHASMPRCRWCGMSIAQRHRRGLERVWGLLARRGLYTCEWCHRRQWHRYPHSYAFLTRPRRSVQDGPQTSLSNGDAAARYPMIARPSLRGRVDACLRTFVGACLSIGRSMFERFGVPVRHATTTFIGFTFSVVIVSARAVVAGIRRSTPSARRGVRLCSMATATSIAGFVRPCSSAAPRGGAWARRNAAWIHRWVPVVRTWLRQAGESAVRAGSHASRALVRRDAPVSAVPYSLVVLCGVVFLCGVAVNVLMTVARLAPEERAGALPDTSRRRTPVELGSPADRPSSAVSLPLSADGAGGGVNEVGVAPPRGLTVPGRPVGQVSGSSPTAVGSRAPDRGRARGPAGVAAAREREDRQSFRGSMAVGSRPEGADVFLNGRRAGRTPLVLTDVPAGSTAVRVTMDGHQPWSRAIQVVAYQRTRVTATLERSGSD